MTRLALAGAEAGPGGQPRAVGRAGAPLATQASQAT